MSHTPGPWELDDKNAVFGPAGGYGAHVADVHSMVNDDARLIAAAPELLEALKAFRDVAWPLRADDACEFVYRLRKVAVELIAKVEGK